jgi:4-amino-4-deoxy-L-arabinose transferase-like glycosyltransferase
MPGEGFRRARRLRWVGLVAWFGLLCVCLPSAAVHLDRYPAVWLDEGYKMNAGRTLAEHGVYGTATVEGYLPFDPGIASGPADVVPLAGSFRLFGVGVAQARATFVLYTLLAALALYGLAASIFGHRIARFAATAVLAAPPLAGTGLLLVGRQVLGEAPALALVATGVLCWVRGWDRPGLLRHVVGGLLIGIGLLSKTQIGLALLPALCIVGIGRAWPQRRLLARELVPTALAVGVIGGWALLARVFTTPAQQQANAAMLGDAIRSNLITGLWGQELGHASQAMIAIMLLSTGIGAWRLWRSRGDGAVRSHAWWVETLLVCFVAFYAAWFALLSVGWPRYAFAGFVTALLLLVGYVATALHVRWPGRPLLRAAWVLIGAGLAVQMLTARHAPPENFAAQTVSYIDGAIAPAAVVETWEWELSGLSRHRAFHHPHQRYMFQAIRQFSHAGRAFDLHYDALQANPDYVIVGAFGAWTRIYPPDTLAREFTLVQEIGPYRIYRRLRSGHDDPQVRWRSGSGSTAPGHLDLDGDVPRHTADRHRQRT